MLKLLTQKTTEKGAKLVAVSKTHPKERIQVLYDEGQRVFGENKVQELSEKYESLPKDIQWHFIGTLQSNKVKYIAPFISLIHSVDSEKLLLEIEKQGAKLGRVIPCLLQFHIAQEETKHGFAQKEAQLVLDKYLLSGLAHVQIAGVMGMATYTDHAATIQKEFRELQSIFRTLKEGYFQDQSSFKEVSMGMSGDWELALEEGSTLIRVGSLLFGSRS
jgi:PLP dependent protein